MNTQEQQTVSLSGAWYMVGVLMVAYTFSFIDRSILSLLVGPIRSDLDISDTQFSLLHGLAFALFYTGLGIPIARLADRYSRKHIISIGTFDDAEPFKLVGEIFIDHKPAGYDFAGELPKKTEAEVFAMFSGED